MSGEQARGADSVTSVFGDTPIIFKANMGLQVKISFMYPLG